MNTVTASVGISLDITDKTSATVDVTHADTRTGLLYANALIFTIPIGRVVNYVFRSFATIHISTKAFLEVVRARKNMPGSRPLGTRRALQVQTVGRANY